MTGPTPDWNRLVGVPLPSDFPSELLFEVHDLVTSRLRSEIFEHYAGAWNAIAYRSCHDLRLSTIDWSLD